VLKVTNEHGGKVTRPADGLWRLRTLVTRASQIVEQSLPMSRVQVLLAAVCFGTTGTAQALGPDASAVTVGAVRVAVGAVLLLLVARAVGDGTTGAVWPRGPLAIGALGVAGYQLCFFAAVKDTGVAVGTVVALGSAPALAGAGGWLLDRRVPDRSWALATVLACAGVATLALAGGGSEVSAPGVALAVGAGASYAAFTLASKRLLDAGHGVERVMARLFGLGALLLTPVLVFGDLHWVTSGGGAAMALWLGAVPTALAYLLFASGLRHLPANEVATLTLAEPVTATLLGAIVLSERPGAIAIAGIAAILAGLAVLAIPKRTERTPPVEVIA
jgi:DME family drug/metabolite transporter